MGFGTVRGLGFGTPTPTPNPKPPQPKPIYYQGNYAAAATAFRGAVQVDPSDAAAYNNLGNVLDELKDWPGAVKAWQQVTVLLLHAGCMRS